MPVDYAIHWALELLGGGACTCAVRWCPHRWMQIALWIVFSIASTIATVQIVG